jgi:O-antigen ligase
MYIFRSAIYPIFLWILKSVFGSQFEIATIFTQILIGLSSIYIFVSRLKKLTNLNPLWHLLLAMIIATPYVYNHCIANRYLSEALAYPLYLLTTIYFLESFLTSNIKKLLISIPILFALVLTRSQFLFMLPIGIFILFWISIKQKAFKKNIWIFIVLFIFPVFTSFADKAYHQIKHGYFVNTPWTGICIITPAFYVSDEKDFQLFKSKDEQQFFSKIYNKLYANQLNIYNINKVDELDETSYYISNYSKISNRTIYDLGIESFSDDLSENQKIIALDKLTKKMTLPLVLDNFRLWFKVYIKNSINAFGNARYALIYLMILVFGCVGLINTEKNTYKVIVLLSLLTLGNVALVALGMHTIKRFTFYNDWVLFFIIFILMERYFKHKESNI